MERFRVIQGGMATKTYENGVSVHVVHELKRRPIAGPVAKHEAAHALRKIVSATIIPDGNSLGKTIPYGQISPDAAALPEALGYQGTSWDMHVVEHGLGVSRRSAIAQANALYKGQEEDHAEIAVILQERLTIGQKDVDEARYNVRKRRRGIFPVQVQVDTPDGKTESYTTETVDGNVLLPNRWHIIRSEPNHTKLPNSKPNIKRAA